MSSDFRSSLNPDRLCSEHVAFARRTLDIGHWTFLQIFNVDWFNLIRQIKSKHS